MNNMENSNQQNENDYNNYINNNASQSKGPDYPSQSQVENQYVLIKSYIIYLFLS